MLTGAGGILNANTVLATFVLFCRIGACLMLMPGVSSSQIPMQVRLFVAVATTLSLAPILIDQAALKAVNADPIPLLRLIVVEALVGGLIGLLGRMFYLALEAMATGASTMLGMANPFGVQLEPGEAMQPLASLVTMSATVLIFVTNMHWEVLRGLAASYHAIPLGADFDAGYSLRHLVDILGDTFRIALRVCSPFFVYAVVVNFAMSLIARLAPQISIFYIIAPFVIAGGLVLFYFTIRSLLGEFMASFGAWLLSG
ncbi:MAG: flagellar biosynthetic protein FliR [Hyphomicrobiales bacterium]|nr:flagellar biosynthetic protein FliR [Hyphomicrobiales bacterium]